MNLVRAIIMLFLSSGALASHLQPGAPPQSQSRPYAISRHNEGIVLKWVRPVLRDSGYAGLIEYSGFCRTNHPAYVEFPKIGISQPRQTTPLDAIRDIFADNMAVKISEEPNKVIIINIGSPSVAIIHTKISSLRLAPIIQYNPGIAVYAIMGAGQVKARMDQLNFHTTQYINFGMLVAEPAPGLPHLPAVLKDISVEEIFKLIAQTFHGIVVYGTCIQPNGRGFLKVKFMGLAN